MTGVEPGHGPIAVVGGGAASTFLLHALAERDAASRPVVVIDPARRIGPGVAYSTPDPVHLMNVCRIRLSADGDGGRDLVDWLAERGVTAGDDTYLQRAMYGDYLVDVTDRSRDLVPVEHRRARVLSAGRSDDERTGWHLGLDDGSTVRATDVVLATGFPSRPALPCPSVEDPRVVVDPWCPRAFDRPVRRAAIVGTGLTMVDAALSLVERHPDVEIVAASRRGLVPRSSRPGLPATIDPSLLPEPGIGRRDLVRHVIDLGRRSDDWQAVVDNVRPRANDLWRALPYGDQRRLLHRWFPWWNVHRHRTAPAVGDRLAGLVASGQLRIVRDRVRGIDAPNGSSGRLRVRASRPTLDRLEVDLVVNAAGPGENLAGNADPLLRSLLDQGLAVVGPHGLGLAVDRAGRARGRDGDVTPGLRLIGALRRGTEWETTAVPEIRAQADVVADHLTDPSSVAEDRSVEVGRC